jgi:uncharacterized protein (TIGR03435 family)
MRTALVLVFLALPCALRTQDPQLPSTPSTFDVASVKRNPDTPAGRMTFQVSAGGRLTVENMPLRLLIQRAYGIRPFQISGGPAWIDSDRYDIAAKSDAPAPEKQVTGPMLQALLEDRFALKLRRETKALPVLNLTQTDGAKLTPSKKADCADAAADPSPTGPSPLPCHEVVLSISPTGARLRGEPANTAQFVFTLANILGQPVIDRTSFTGKFDLDLEVSLDGLDGLTDALGIRGATTQSPDSMVPSILTALPQQLGLKLTAGKGPVEVLVIEHVERPSGN